MRPLGFRLVFCHRAPESFEAARAERLKISGNPSQYDDLQAFITEQEELRTLVQASSLPSLSIDLSEDDVQGAAGKIADWLEQTGGLTL